MGGLRVDEEYKEDKAGAREFELAKELAKVDSELMLG